MDETFLLSHFQQIDDACVGITANDDDPEAIALHVAEIEQLTSELRDYVLAAGKPKQNEQDQ